MLDKVRKLLKVALKNVRSANPTPLYSINMAFEIAKVLLDKDSFGNKGLASPELSELVEVVFPILEWNKDNDYGLSQHHFLQRLLCSKLSDKALGVLNIEILYELERELEAGPLFDDEMKERGVKLHLQLTLLRILKNHSLVDTHFKDDVGSLLLETADTIDERNFLAGIWLSSRLPLNRNYSSTLISEMRRIVGYIDDETIVVTKMVEWIVEECEKAVDIETISIKALKKLNKTTLGSRMVLKREILMMKRNYPKPALGYESLSELN